MGINQLGQKSAVALEQDSRSITLQIPGCLRGAGWKGTGDRAYVTWRFRKAVLYLVQKMGSTPPADHLPHPCQQSDGSASRLPPVSQEPVDFSGVPQLPLWLAKALKFWANRIMNHFHDVLKGLIHPKSLYPLMFSSSISLVSFNMLNLWEWIYIFLSMFSFWNRLIIIARNHTVQIAI